MSINEKVVVYVTQSCPFCVMAQRLLDAKNVTYRVIDVGRERTLWAEMAEKSGRQTVPQIFIGSHHVGGFDDLSLADKRGEIDMLLKKLN